MKMRSRTCCRPTALQPCDVEPSHRFDIDPQRNLGGFLKDTINSGIRKSPLQDNVDTARLLL